MASRHALFILALCLLGFSPLARAQVAETIVVSAPGPRNLSYLPIDLIPAIGADAEEGVRLRILTTGGGAVALNNLVTRNADFAVAGLPAALSLHSNGGDVVAVAAVNDAPLFVLMVRSALKDKVQRIADLKGKVIGVNTSTRSSKTTSQQLAELLLQSEGVTLNQVRIVPAGQSWVEQSSLMISGMADATVGDEPFASRLAADGHVFFLANLADAATAARIPGGGFLHAAVETRSDVIRDAPHKVEKMVRMVKRSLHWIATHSPTEVVDRLGITDATERAALIGALERYPQAYSKTGEFSTRQLADTEIFFRKTSARDPQAQALRVEQIINDRWAGRVP